MQLTAPWLILLSIVFAVEGGYLGLRLTVQTAAAAAAHRLLLAGAAFSFGAAIWVLHFTAVLAAPSPSAFLVFPLLLSFLLGVLIAGAAVYALVSGPFTPARLALAAGLLAAAIVAMHVVAMSAVPAQAAASALAVAAGVLIAFAGSALAFWLAAGPAGLPLLLGAVVFGLAVAATHFVMASVALVPQPAAAGPALSGGVLAIVVAVVAFAITALFLLSLVPERAEAAAESLEADFAAGTESAAEEIPIVAAAAGSGSDAKLRRGIYAPLGGAGAPPPRLADHLPFERDGATHYVPVEDVVAVQANAHYTYLFDGKTKLFCPLAIGEVESRLDRGRFMRVHRSHIVNIERVIGYKRSGDSETVELAAEERYTVPVSRSRAGWLKSRIDEKNDGSAAGAPPRASAAE